MVTITTRFQQAKVCDNINASSQKLVGLAKNVRRRTISSNFSLHHGRGVKFGYLFAMLDKNMYAVVICFVT